ncbi:MAG: hypothetical protein HC821_04680 [Lewinella sp.]|nr:hypothetical protein [Lewinella sp.]
MSGSPGHWTVTRPAFSASEDDHAIALLKGANGIPSWLLVGGQSGIRGFEWLP